jgi:hypothetical protein
MSISRPHAPAHVAGNDAPLIGERAATRGRSVMEAGGEHTGVKGRHPFVLQPREPDRPAGTSTRWRPLDRLKRLGENPAGNTRSHSTGGSALR